MCLMRLLVLAIANVREVFFFFFLIGVKNHSYKLGSPVFLEKSDNTGSKC